MAALGPVGPSVDTDLPFGAYPGGGRELLKPPRGDVARRGYGRNVLEWCGFRCAYCGLGDELARGRRLVQNHQALRCPREGYVGEPTLALQLRRWVGRVDQASIVREFTLLHADHDHQGPLPTLCAVDRGQLNPLGIKVLLDDVRLIVESVGELTNPHPCRDLLGVSKGVDGALVSWVELFCVRVVAVEAADGSERMDQLGSVLEVGQRVEHLGGVAERPQTPFFSDAKPCDSLGEGHPLPQGAGHVHPGAVGQVPIGDAKRGLDVLLSGRLRLPEQSQV